MSTLPQRISSVALSVAAIFGATEAVAVTPENPDVFDGFRVVDRDVLSNMRGGFVGSVGGQRLELSFGIEQALFVNDALLVTTRLTVPDVNQPGNAQLQTVTPVAPTPPVINPVVPPTPPTIVAPTAPTPPSIVAPTPPTAPTVVAPIPPTTPAVVAPIAPAVNPVVAPIIPAVVAPTAPTTVLPPTQPAVVAPTPPTVVAPTPPTVVAPTAPTAPTVVGPSPPTITPPTAPVLVAPIAPTPPTPPTIVAPTPPAVVAPTPPTVVAPTPPAQAGSPVSTSAGPQGLATTISSPGATTVAQTKAPVAGQSTVSGAPRTVAVPLGSPSSLQVQVANAGLKSVPLRIGDVTVTTMQGSGGLVNLVQIGQGNSFALDPSSLASGVMNVIQNTLDNQTIRQTTAIQVSANSLTLLRANTLSAAFQRQLLQSIR